ncbi:diguanylate cyclase (GGDEF) domain-containing protein [Thiorhodovibrio frisius]|uniref:diguanylate cyclase n=2 Tax=Thiorhodovibrio frisius TaxID=631362 RepID=H8Z4U5_9GAMM|nr:diguanylate cyclase (GGDEF) domain-containing protein [Thiorhodovibrio frisius]WPL21092.1 Stalked cell differentiation-controlling protein [Thiorhodovibrio frisius]
MLKDSSKLLNCHLGGAEGIMRSMTSYSVLFVEDNEEDYLQVNALLEQIPGTEYRVRWARTVEDAETLVVESDPQAFDLCLVGDHAGEGAGIRFISAHSADIEFPPMIFLADQADADIDQAALDAGAMDYLHKSELSLSLVERSIRYCVAQHATKQELVKLATIDPLTGILNRRALYDLGDKEFDRATRYGHPLSLLLIAVDRFKDVNGTFGHEVGDKALHSVVATVLAAIRETDVFGRFGGSEFLLILPHTDVGGASLLAERIKDGVKKQPIMQGSAVIELSVSCGVSATSEQAGFFDELVVCADRALYQDKPTVV